MLDPAITDGANLFYWIVAGGIAFVSMLGFLDQRNTDENKPVEK